MSLASGHKWFLLEGEELTELMNDFSDLKSYFGPSFVHLTPGRWFFPGTFLRYADSCYNFEFRENDVVVMSSPKSGTSWTQEIVWTMMNNPDLNHPSAGLPLVTRSVMLESDMFHLTRSTEVLEGNLFVKPFLKQLSEEDLGKAMMIRAIETLPDPRTIKTHLPISLLSPTLLDTTKVVYVARNPKDIIVSNYHHCRLWKGFRFVGSIEKFVRHFIDEKVFFGPYWHHLKEAWQKRDHPHLHFIFYEDLKGDIMGELRKMNVFLNTELREDQLKGIAEYTSFSEMKARNALLGVKNEENECFIQDVVQKHGGFFRKGETGDWKRWLTPELETKIDDWINTNTTNLNINFKYSL